MVHVLSAPRPTGIGSALGQVIGSFAGNEIGYQLQKQRMLQEEQRQKALQEQERQVQQSRLQNVLNQYNPNAPLEQQVGLISQLPPEVAKNISPLLQTIYKQKQQQDLMNQIFGYGPQQKNQEIVSDQLQKSLKEQQFDPTQITDQQIAAATVVNPQLGQRLQQLKDVALRERRSEEQMKFEKQKFEASEEKKTPEFKREEALSLAQAQSDIKYNQQLQDIERQNELKSKTLDRLEDLNKKGVTGKPYEKLLENMGLVALTSEGRREFAADVKNLITDIRSILGAQFTGFEFQTILNAYPSADFSKEANKAIINNLKEFQEIKNQEIEIAERLKKQNKGKIPFDFQSRVNEQVREYARSRADKIKQNTQKIMNEEYNIPKGHVLMLDPDGEPISVPESDIEKLISLGAILP